MSRRLCKFCSGIFGCLTNGVHYQMYVFNFIYSKIHKANEKLAKQNLQLKSEIKVLKEQLSEVRMGGEGDQYLDKSMTFQNQSPDVRGLESTEKKSRD